MSDYEAALDAATAAASDLEDATIRERCDAALRAAAPILAANLQAQITQLEGHISDLEARR